MGRYRCTHTHTHTYTHTLAHTQHLSIDHSRFINDEHSPSIFRRTSMRSGDDSGAPQAHHAWKPVVYGNTTRKPTNMTVTELGELGPLDYAPATEYKQHIITSSFDSGRT